MDDSGFSRRETGTLNGSTTEGIFEDLSPEGFPRIRKDDGSLYIHLSGDLILDPKDV